MSRSSKFSGLSPSILLTVALGLGAAPSSADQDDGRLDALFEVLQSTSNPTQAHAAEVEIWQIWIESGHEEIDALMAEGVAAMRGGQLAESIELFGQVVARAPEFAEGWNKRATALFYQDELAASVHDIRRTLELEPRHFGAISGMGLIFLRRGDDAGALDAFEAALDVHPHARGAASRAEQLRQKLNGQGV